MFTSPPKHLDGDAAKIEISELPSGLLLQDQLLSMAQVVERQHKCHSTWQRQATPQKARSARLSLAEWLP